MSNVLKLTFHPLHQFGVSLTAEVDVLGVVYRVILNNCPIVMA